MRVNPGETISVNIKDLTYSTTVSFADEHVKAKDRSWLLWDIQDKVVQLMETAFEPAMQKQDNTVTVWYDWIREKADNTYQDNRSLLVAMRECHDHCQRSSESRWPAVWESVIGQIVLMMNGKSPDKRRGDARRFLDALGMDEGSVTCSGPDNRGMAPFLVDSGNKIQGDNRTVYGIALFTNVFLAYKVVIAAHHPEDYPHVPFHFLRGLVVDLHASLESFEGQLSRHLQAMRRRE